MTRSLIAALLAGLCGCGQPAPPPPPAPPIAAAVAVALPGTSVYQLSAALVNQAGAEVGIGLHRGHPTIVAMFYASCPMACPMMIADLKALEAELSDEARGRLRVLLISLDPETDGPAQLAEVASRHELDTARWSLTRPEPAAVREIAAALGIQYRKLESGEFHHSSLLTLLDCDGVPVSSAEGGGPALEPLRRAIREQGCGG